MSQRLLLDVVGGPQKGRTYPVLPNGSVLIGRLPECEIAIPEDLTVSRQHCRIEFVPPVCRLVHLSQTGHTLVNDSIATTVDLKSGDLISFGTGNLVRVRMEELRTGTEPTVHSGSSEAAETGHAVRFLSRALDCGWKTYTCIEPVLDFEQLLKTLNLTQQVHVMFDFNRMKLPAPETLTGAQPLFPWLAPEMQPQFSPMLVSPASLPAAIENMRAGWGRDGVVCFGAKADGDAVLAHWQKASGIEDGKPGKSITVYYWPSILRQLLACQTAAQLEPFLSGLQWLLVEETDSPGSWRLYAEKSFDTVLAAAGIVLSESAETKV